MITHKIVSIVRVHDSTSIRLQYEYEQQHECMSVILNTLINWMTFLHTAEFPRNRNVRHGVEYIAESGVKFLVCKTANRVYYCVLPIVGLRQISRC